MKQFNSVQVLNKTTDFVLIQYNVHSLINFEERMQRVLYELEGRHWDAVAFAETRRSECDEDWKTRWGDVVYAQLDLEVARSKNRKTKIVIAGDWNVSVGQAQDDDDDQLVGQTNFGHRSERRTQFVKWCTLHGYVVANTFSAETDQMDIPEWKERASA